LGLVLYRGAVRRALRFARVLSLLYPSEVSHTLREDIPTSMPSPRYQGTAREWYHTEMDKLRSENWRLISENERLRQRAKA
jgi:hypothetical protein